MSSDSVNEFINELKGLALQRTRRSQELHNQFEAMSLIPTQNDDPQAYAATQVSKVKQFSDLMRKTREEDKLRSEKENWILHSLKTIQQFTQNSKRGVYSACVEVMKSMYPSFQGYIQLEELSDNAAEFRHQFGQLFQCFFQPFEKAYEFKSSIKILLKPTNNNIVQDLLKYLIEFSRDSFTSFLSFWREKTKLQAKTQPTPKIPLLSSIKASVDQQCNSERDEQSSTGTTPSTGTAAAISTASTIEERQSPKKYTRSLSPTKAIMISAAPKRIVSPLKKIASEAFLHVKDPEIEPKRVSETIRFVSPTVNCQQWERFKENYESNNVSGDYNLNAMPFDSSVLSEVIPELDQVHLNVHTFKMKKLKESLDKQPGIPYNEELNILRNFFESSYEQNAYISNSIQAYLSRLHDAYNTSQNFPSLLGEILSASLKTNQDNNSNVAHRLVLRMQKFRILFAKRYSKSKADLANVSMNWSNSVINGTGGQSVSQQQSGFNEGQQQQSPLRNRLIRSKQSNAVLDTSQGKSPSFQNDSKRYNYAQTAADSDDSPSKYYCNNSMSSFSKASYQQIKTYQNTDEYTNEGELKQEEELLPWTTTEGHHNEEFGDHCMFNGVIDEQIDSNKQENHLFQSQKISDNQTGSKSEVINNKINTTSEELSDKTVQQGWQITQIRVENKSPLKTSFHQKHHSLISRPSSSKDISNIPSLKVQNVPLADVSQQQLAYLSEISSPSSQLKSISSQLHLVAVNSPREVKNEKELSTKQSQHQSDIAQLQLSKQYAIKQKEQSPQQKNFAQKFQQQQQQQQPSLILLHAKREKLLGSRSIAAFKTFDSSNNLSINDINYKTTLQIQGIQALETQPKPGINNTSTAKTNQHSKVPPQISKHRKDIQLQKETISQPYSAQFSSFQDIFDDSQILSNFNTGNNKLSSEPSASSFVANRFLSQNQQSESSELRQSVSVQQSPTQPSKANCSSNPCELPTKIIRMYDQSCGSAFLKPLEESLGEISLGKAQQSQGGYNKNNKVSVMKGKHSKSTAVLAGFGDLLTRNRCSADEEAIKDLMISRMKEKQVSQDKSTLFLYSKAALKSNSQHNNKSFNSSRHQVHQGEKVLKISSDSASVPVSSRTDSTKNTSNICILQSQISQNLRNSSIQSKQTHLDQQKTNKDKNQANISANNLQQNNVNFNDNEAINDNLQTYSSGSITPTSRNDLNSERRHNLDQESVASLKQHKMYPKQQLVITQPINQRYFFNHSNSLSEADGFAVQSNTLVQSFNNVSNSLSAEQQQNCADSPLKTKSRLIRVSRNSSQDSLINQSNNYHKQCSSYSLLLSSSCNTKELTSSGNNAANQMKQAADNDSHSKKSHLSYPEIESNAKKYPSQNLQRDPDQQIEVSSFREGGTQKQFQKKSESLINGKLQLAGISKRIPSNEDCLQQGYYHQMQQNFPVRVISTNTCLVQEVQAGSLESKKVAAKKAIASSSVTFKKPTIPKQPGWNGLYRNYQPLLQ